jgi:hypothetical protein
MSQITKRLDATSGESAEFEFKDDLSVKGKFVITGTAGANIKIFEIREERAEKLLYKALCSNWNGATVALHLKTDHTDDSFSATGVVFSDNRAIESDYR